MAAGSWVVAAGRWVLAAGNWVVAAGSWAVASGRAAGGHPKPSMADARMLKKLELKGSIIL